MQARTRLGLLLGGASAIAALALLARRELHRRRIARLGSIGFAGLGNMGEPIARRLLRKHLALAVWNRTESRCAALLREGALVAPSLDYLLRSCDTVLLMLTGDEALRLALASLGGRLRTLVCLSTVSPEMASEAAARCAAKGVDFVCCPVTGRPDRAAAGTLAAWVSHVHDPCLKAL